MTGKAAVDPVFGAYLEVRDAVERMIHPRQDGIEDGIDSVTRPSDYWAEELEQIDYLAEASPLIIRKLRQHAFLITGIRPYDYRDKGDGRRQNFEARLGALRAMDTVGLLVPESPALGGFGYRIDGQLFNIDTLKFYETLIGMERAGVLPALRAIDRPMVCEIGAGWGGFAYQFKTLFPRASYVIVDFPELFFFSATYLRSLFPGATLRFVESEQDAAMRPGDADFVFVPHTLAPAISSFPLDAVVNMASFQEMTHAQVSAYAGLAAEAGCPLIYSMNRERSPHNSELTSVTAALGERYQLADVPMLDTDYITAMKRPSKPGKTAALPELAYRHHVGRLSTVRRARPRTDGNSVPAGPAAPSVVLGMTLYNNARHLRESLESLLDQTYHDFVLVLLDDASSDETESIAREFEARDPRVRYFRHTERKAMIATWREVVALAISQCPSATRFAWVSDHDRWHPRWLAAMVAELDRDPEAVLAYPITRRIAADTGEEIEKGPRLFETPAGAGVQERWAYFCRHGVGSGDMVYGLMRIDALARADVFRTVLRPDRLLIAELTLSGHVRQVQEALWFRRQSAETSVARQRRTLVLDGEAPPWFGAPPWLQHARALWQEYVAREPRPIPLSTAQWLRMLAQYQLRYGWRHLRKSETSHAVGRGIDNAIWARKMVRHHYHHAVYNLLVGGRALFGRVRRLTRRAIYHVLVFLHWIGLRRDRGETPVQ